MRRPQFSGVARGVAGAVALLGLAACNTTTASAPDDPAYDLDVRPILMAHCVRCHGAGDMLNVPKEPTGPNAPTQSNLDVTTFTALNYYFDRYSNDGAKNGAYTARSAIASSVLPSADPKTLMPPAPAARLTDWELDVLQKWSKNPICSADPNSNNPVCPNGPGPGP